MRRISIDIFFANSLNYIFFFECVIIFISFCIQYKSLTLYNIILYFLRHFFLWNLLFWLMREHLYCVLFTRVVLLCPYVTITYALYINNIVGLLHFKVNVLFLIVNLIFFFTYLTSFLFYIVYILFIFVLLSDLNYFFYFVFLYNI